MMDQPSCPLPTNICQMSFEESTSKGGAIANQKTTAATFSSQVEADSIQSPTPDLDNLQDPTAPFPCANLDEQNRTTHVLNMQVNQMATKSAGASRLWGSSNERRTKNSVYMHTNRVSSVLGRHETPEGIYSSNLRASMLRPKSFYKAKTTSEDEQLELDFKATTGPDNSFGASLGVIGQEGSLLQYSGPNQRLKRLLELLKYECRADETE
ncbi:unnamed protein product, partial [Protopolystoma xenopodis]